ncbi:MAG: C4-dicarboxylic acid transporter DauA [Polyangia bacterium]
MALTRYQSTLAGKRFSRLPAAALRAVVREGYTRADLKRDVLAGLVVGLVALPLAMALAIGVGVPPQHGLYTAIVAGVVVAALGGSRTQVTGPTAAFIVILAPIYARFGLAGLLTSGMLGGLLLIGMGVGRLGQFIEFIPHPVTTGFTAGIAVVIATLQLKDFFGLTLISTPEHYFDRVAAMWDARATVSLPDFAIGATTLILLVGVRRATQRIPAPLIALPVAALLAVALEHLVPGVHVATVARRFHVSIGGHVFDGVPPLPPLPMLPWHAPGPDGHPFVLSLATLRELMPGAFAVAMLGGIESLLSAVVADGMAGTRHDPDAELLAQGVGNLITPFFGGIPATGAIARTATNIRSGGRSPVAAIVHALTVLVSVVALAPLIGHLPMAAMAALLLLVAWNISEVKHFAHIARVAPRSDTVILLTCFGLTVVFDMVVAVSVGIVLAALLFMRRMAELTRVSLIGDLDSDQNIAVGTSQPHHPAQKAELPKGVAIYEIAGPLFFGAAQKATSQLADRGQRTKVLIIRLEHVPAMDATGLVALESSLSRLYHAGCQIILCGVQRQPLELLTRAKIVETAGKLSIRRDLPAAIDRAREIVNGLAIHSSQSAL